MTNIFIFESSPITKPREKSGGDMAYYAPRLKQWGVTCPVSPTKLRPW